MFLAGNLLFAMWWDNCTKVAQLRGAMSSPVHSIIAYALTSAHCNPVKVSLGKSHNVVHGETGGGIGSTSYV